MESLTVYVTVRYKCENFVDQATVDEYGLENVVKRMFEDETPEDWASERPELVLVSLKE